MKFFANLKCSSAGSATAEDPSAQIVSLEQIPLQRLLSQSPSWSREVSGQKMPMPDSSELLRLADQILQCWDKGKAGFPEQAFRQKLCQVKCALICSSTGLSSSSSDLVSHCFCLQPESILPTINVRSTTIYFTVCLFSVGGESFWEKILEKNKHTHICCNFPYYFTFHN